MLTHQIAAVSTPEVHCHIPGLSQLSCCQTPSMLISCCRYQEDSEGQDSISVTTGASYEMNTRTYTSDCSIFDTSNTPNVDHCVISDVYSFHSAGTRGVGSSNSMSISQIGYMVKTGGLDSNLPIGSKDCGEQIRGTGPL